MLPIVSMRKSVAIPAVLVTLLGFCLGASSMAQTPIRWTEDFDAAVRHATTNNLPLLLHFYGDNCPPCRLLEKKAFQDRELIAKINQHVVPVRINGERQRELRTRYQVNRWPTDVYLLPNGEEIHRTVSPQDPAVYGQTIDRVALRHRDWTVEQNAQQVATERKMQNRTSSQLANAAPTGASLGGDGYRSPANSGPTTHPVSTSGAAAQRAIPAANQRVISNPYASNDPNQAYSSGMGTVGVPGQVQQVPSTSNQPGMNAALSTMREPNPSLANMPIAHQSPSSSYSPATGYGDSELSASPAVPRSPNPSVSAYTATDVVSGTPSTPTHDAAYQNGRVSDLDRHPSLPPTSPTSKTTSGVPPQNGASSPNGGSQIPAANQSSNSLSPSTPVYAETIGLEGYCPVTLFKGVQSGAADSWVDGNSEYAVRHRGRIYFCRDEAARREFLQAPDRYAPCLSCFDLIHFVKSGKLLDGKCEFGCFQSGTGRVFLFATQENCDEFKRSEAYYSKLVEDTSGRVATQPLSNPVR